MRIISKTRRLRICINLQKSGISGEIALEIFAAPARRSRRTPAAAGPTPANGLDRPKSASHKLNANIGNLVFSMLPHFG
jgi:hypothetical protein